MNKYHKQRGATSIIVGLMIVVFIGFLGLAIDFGYAYLKRTQLQSAADAQALACVINPLSPTDICQGSYSGDDYGTFANYHFTNFGVNYVNPDTGDCPVSSAFRNCVKVTIRDTWNTFFVHMFGITTLSTYASAVAGRTGGGAGCVIASSYFTVQGSQGLNGSNCANYFGSVSVTGNPPITGSANYVYNGNSASSCSTCSPRAVSIAGPLNAPSPSPPITPPSNAGTPSGPWVVNSPTSITCQSTKSNPGPCYLSPGRYTDVDCSSDNCVFLPDATGNIFRIDGTFKGPDKAQNTLTGQHVLVYFGGASSQSVTLGGNGSLSLSAPYTGACGGNNSPTSEIVMYAPNVATITYGGNAATNVVGNIYMPNSQFALSGNGGLNMQGTLVASSYADSGGGNSGLTIDGSNSCGFAPQGAGVVVLVQ